LVDQCSLCTRPRESPSEFCSLHDAALRNLDAEYASWRKAFGGSLRKDEYFAKLLSLSETGGAVKKLIEHIQNKAGTP
jgi:hypothetical protein